MTAGDRSDSATVDELVMQLMPALISVGQVRRQIGAFCRASNHASLADDAALLASELMTKACRHSTGLITVLALTTSANVVVTVTDHDVEHAPRVVPDPHSDRDSGRGLHLVAAIASAWGVTTHTDSKSVWFRLP